MDLLLSPAGEPHSAAPSTVLSQKSSHMATKMPGVYGRAQWKAVTRLSVPCYWMAAQWCPQIPRCLVLEKQYTLFKCAPRKGMFSPSVTQGSATHYAVHLPLPGSCLPSPQEHCFLSGWTLQINFLVVQNVLMLNSFVQKGGKPRASHLLCYLTSSPIGLFLFEVSSVPPKLPI